MKKILFTFLFLSTLCVADTTDNNTLILGQYPFLSPDMLLYRMQPIADYYQRKTGRKVVFKTASSYESFLANAKRGEYDIAYAPAHFAARLCSDYDYQPHMILDMDYSALIITLAKTTIKNPKDLIGKKIAIPNPQALVVRTALNELAKLGIKASDLLLLKKSTHDRSLHALFTGEVEAAIVSTNITASIPTDILGKLHVVEVYGDLMGDVIIINNKVANLIVDKNFDFEGSSESNELKERWKFYLKLRPTSNAELSPMKALAPE